MSNVQITNLGAAIALNGTEQLEIVQAGTSVRTTTQDVGNAATEWAEKGANTDITSLSGLTGDISQPDSIRFDTTAGVTPVEGQIAWNATDDTLSIGMNSGGVQQLVGFQTFYRVKALGQITKGEVVMAVGAVGNSGVIEASTATGLGVNDGQLIMGVASQSIATGNFGYVTAFGLVQGIQTNGANYGEVWADGDILWYNPASPGGFTKTVPVAPNPRVLMAIVIKANPSNGSLFIRVTAGSVLGGTDGNVQITSLQNGQFLTYDGGQSRWENSTTIYDVGGNIGIGTSSPQNKLQVSGDGVRSTVQASTSAGEVRFEAQVNDYWSGPTYIGSALGQYGSTAAGTTAGISNGSLGYLIFQNTSAGLVYTNGSVPLLFGTTSAERMRIDASGNVGIGTSAPTSLLNLYAATGATLTVEGNAATNNTIIRSSTDATGPSYNMRKARGTTASRSTVASGDILGNMNWQAFGGTNNRTLAIIRGTVGTYTSDSDISAYLSFFTTPTGSVTAVERMRVDDAGNVGIGTGSPTQKLDVNDDSIRVRTAKTPANASDTGTQGQIAWDSSYVYVCVATNTWKRAAISTW